MPKKKQIKNSFYFFMRDFKEEQEQMGVRFVNGMKEVADLAGPVWTNLPENERSHYENLAAEHKQKEKGDLKHKFTTMGVSYLQLQKEEQDKRTAEETMINEIQGTVQSLDRDTALKTHNFYFIHFNYYCRVDDGSYLVCEVAVAQFNIQDGIKDTYHTIIRHARIPTGYTYAAKQNADDTHQIPLPHDLQEGEPYRGRIFLNIKSFIEQVKMPNGLLPPLYTIDNHVEVAQTTLTEMTEFHYPQNLTIFRVYPLSKLFYWLRNAASPPGVVAFPVDSVAERELDKDLYNYAPYIACKLHENDTRAYCSKSIVTRWGYLICDHCCKDLRIPLVPGKHVPYNADIEGMKAKEAALEDDGWMPVRKSKPAHPPSYANKCAPASGASGPPKLNTYPVPLRVVDMSKVGPSEENIHHYNLNAASVPKSAAKVTENCWGPRPEGPLRRPTKLPSSVQDALHFSNEDFPSLGSSGRSNHVKMPAAVAGRGRGRARILLDDDPPKPGGLKEIEGAASYAAAGRGIIHPDTVSEPGGLDEFEGAASYAAAGRGRIHPDAKVSGSRLAANFDGLNLE